MCFSVAWKLFYDIIMAKTRWHISQQMSKRQFIRNISRWLRHQLLLTQVVKNMQKSLLTWSLVCQALYKTIRELITFIKHMTPSEVTISNFLMHERRQPVSQGATTTHWDVQWRYLNIIQTELTWPHAGNGKELDQDWSTTWVPQVPMGTMHCYPQPNIYRGCGKKTSSK